MLQPIQPCYLLIQYAYNEQARKTVRVIGEKGRFSWLNVSSLKRQQDRSSFMQILSLKIRRGDSRAAFVKICCFGEFKMANYEEPIHSYTHAHLTHGKFSQL